MKQIRRISTATQVKGTKCLMGKKRHFALCFLGLNSLKFVLAMARGESCVHSSTGIFPFPSSREIPKVAYVHLGVKVSGPNLKAFFYFQYGLMLAEFLYFLRESSFN
jgi:hypothetical protein